MPNIGVGGRHELDQQVLSKFLKVENEDATLGVHDRVVEVDSDSSAVTLTLPQVDEAAGKIFTFTANDGVTNAVTVQDNDESKNWSDITLGSDNATLVLYSDGITWHTLVDTS